MRTITIERTEPHLPTGVYCSCGREVKARNKKAQKAIKEYRGDEPLKCAACFEEYSRG